MRKKPKEAPYLLRGLPKRHPLRKAAHRNRMERKDSLRFGSYMYRPHPAHFVKPIGRTQNGEMARAAKRDRV